MARWDSADDALIHQYGPDPRDPPSRPCQEHPCPGCGDLYTFCGVTPDDTWRCRRCKENSSA